MTLVKLVHRVKKRFLIVLIVSGIMTLVRLVQSIKKPVPIEVASTKVDICSQANIALSKKKKGNKKNTEFCNNLTYHTMFTNT